MFVILIRYSYTARKKEREKRNERREGEMEGGTEDEWEGKSKDIIVNPCQARALYIYLNYHWSNPMRWSHLLFSDGKTEEQEVPIIFLASK